MPRRASDSASTSGRLSSLYSFVNSNSRGVHVVGTVAPGSLCGSRSLRTGVLPSPAAAIPRPKARTHCGPKNWTQSRLAKAIRHLQGCLLQPLPLPGWLHSPGPIPAEPVFSSGPVRHYYNSLQSARSVPNKPWPAGSAFMVSAPTARGNTRVEIQLQLPGKRKVTTRRGAADQHTPPWCRGISACPRLRIAASAAQGVPRVR